MRNTETKYFPIHPPTKENTAKQNPRRQKSLTRAESTYIVTVQRALQKYMNRHFAKASMTYFEPQDLASFATEKVMASLDKYMQKYPDPIAAAHAVAANSAWDHLRRVRAQRGEGARGERAVIGLQSRVRPGDEDSLTWEDMLVGDFEHPEDVVDRIDAQRDIAGVVDEFTSVGLDGAIATELQGRTQAAVAKDHKVARETVNRAIKQDQRRARAKRAAIAAKKHRAVKASRAKHAHTKGAK
jgi:hypothetical protein